MVAGSSEAAQKAVRVRRGEAGVGQVGARPTKWAWLRAWEAGSWEALRINSNPYPHGAVHLCENTCENKKLL